MKGSLRGGRVFSEEGSVHGRRFNKLKKPPTFDQNDEDDEEGETPLMDAEGETTCFDSPMAKSPWSQQQQHQQQQTSSFLMGSLVREEGHIYSLAASSELLYTGSDSKNIRIWKNQKEFSAFKSNSGLVKAIVIGGGRIFTGHQDGKVRIWRVSNKNPTVHKRIATLPTFSIGQYYRTKRRRSVKKHGDAIAALSLSEESEYVYSASWDKTFKVWRVRDGKCMETIEAHEDAVNTLVTSVDGMVFTGSADGTVKVWRRELQGIKGGTKHFFSQTLIKQDCAVTALAVNDEASFLYCGSSDGLVNFWEREKSLSHAGTLRGHKLAILCMGTAGRLVMSGSADMKICVWERTGHRDHTCVALLTGHTGPVKCLAVDRDRDDTVCLQERHWIVYSGSLDKSVKMWRVSEQLHPSPDSPLPLPHPSIIT